MKFQWSSFSRTLIFSAIILSTALSYAGLRAQPVYAAVKSDRPATSINIPAGSNPQSEPTPAPAPGEDVISFDSKSVSITLIFETIFKWLFGKNLMEIFDDVNLTEEQRRQIEELSGESDPINLVNNFCSQIRSGDFTRMAQSVRESNPEGDSSSPSPAILMDFFEKLGAFCPAE
jgi:hypothetical protein